MNINEAVKNDVIISDLLSNKISIDAEQDMVNNLTCQFGPFWLTGYNSEQ